jgi:hypothetical protein
MPALPTSETYNFQSVQVEILIRDAFERIGILGEFTEPLKLDSARRSINFLLLSWMDKTINLWTLQGAYLPLITGQRQYTLPNTVSNIIQVNLRTSTRQSFTGNGTGASSAGGVAANAFDGNPLTACTQNAINGNISWDFGVNVTQYITFVGIQSNSATLYSLIVEYSQDNINWTPLFTIPPQTFQVGVNTWFDVPTPIAARAYRIRETSGAILNIQEIFFNNNTFDFVISDVSKYEYNTYPNKYLQSRPSVYYLDRQPFAPILNLWPTPSPQYNCLFYSYKKLMQDVGLYTQTIEIPSRFYPALVWGLSWHLALKFKPDIAGMLKGEYEQSFNSATAEDSEGTNISIRGENL